MTMTWAVDPRSSDLVINNLGTLQIIYGSQEVAQRIRITLYHYYREYFLNVPGGLPWYELMLGSKNIKIIEALVRRAVLDVPNVLSIFSLQAVYTNRSLTINIAVSVNGISGPDIISLVTEITHP